MKKVIQKCRATDAAMLLTAIRDMTEGLDRTTVYVENMAGDVVCLELIEEMLTDGSLVYSLKLT